jgi:uncharacterized phage-associated protein
MIKNFLKNVGIRKYYYMVIVTLLYPSISSAQSASNKPLFKNPIEAESFEALIKDLFDAIIQIGYVFVVMALLFAGFKFVVAQGNPEELSKAKKIFLYTVIGAVILLGAQAISEVVCNTAAQFNSTIQC